MMPNAGANLLNMHNYDDFLTGNVGLNAMNMGLYNENLLAASNPMDFLMMDLAANQGLSSLQGTGLLNPHNLDALPSPVLDAMHATPQGLSSLLDMSNNPNHPHLPPLNIDANSHAAQHPTAMANDAHAAFLAGTGIGTGIGTGMGVGAASAPNCNMANVETFQDRDFQQFMSLIQQGTTAPVSHAHSNPMMNACDVDYPLNNPNHAIDPMQPQITPIPPSVSTALETATKNCRKRKTFSAATAAASPPKKRKLNEAKKEKSATSSGRPVQIKKEHKSGDSSKPQKSRSRKRKKKQGDDREGFDLPSYLKNDYDASTENYVGIRTADGEVRIQIPPSSALKAEEAPDGNGLTIKHESKVKFEVFGNACSDRIEDILQPKKRTRYVRGLSEEEKKTRRREQNRNAAARSRARKNAMISKVIQLHQENMGLRAFVAENITQTKLLRDELSRLNGYIQAQQAAQAQLQRHSSGGSTASVAHPKTPPRPPTPPSATSSREEQSASIGTATTKSTSSSSLFDIINGQ